MRNSKKFAAAFAALSLLYVVPASAGASSSPATATVRMPVHGLTIQTDYADRGVTQIVDTDTGKTVQTIVSRPKTGLNKAWRPNSADATATRASGPTAAQRCANGGTYAPFDGQTMRPWRISEPFHTYPSGAPSRVAGSWRTMINNAKAEWEQTKNSCGVSDIIIWNAPMSYDTSTPTDPSCGQPDDQNIAGFADMGGWENGGLVLGRTCVWWNSYIYEADVMFNSNPAAIWCDGAYAGCWDLQSVAAHEFGHSLGLGHVETSATQSTALAVMYPITFVNDVRNRTLSRGDIDGAMALYPRGYAYSFLSATIDNAIPGAKLETNHTYTATVDVLNTGFYPWNLRDSNGLYVSTSPAGRCSSFAGADWRSCSDASVIDEDVTNSGGGPENPDTVVAQGETARFTFQLPVGWDKEGKSLLEQLRVRGLGLPDTPFNYLMDVGTYKATVVDSAPPGLLQGSIVRGMSSIASITVRNDGTAPWLPSDGRIRLVTVRTDGSRGRCSAIAGSDWESACGVVSFLDEPTGAVMPGETGTFDFYFYAPLDTRTYSYTDIERFDVEIAGRPSPMQNQITRMQIEVY